MLNTAKKNEKISAFLDSVRDALPAHFPVEYSAYFSCFNSRKYYEAHDVLEHLWLRNRDGDYAFYKGLIQIAGAFVHLKLHYLHPHHHKHGKRLAPAVRLLELGCKNLEPYERVHNGLDLDRVRAVCETYRQAILTGRCQCNPWRPETAPQISLEPDSFPP